MSISNHFDITDEFSQAVWRFNFRPDSYIHPSWLATMPDGKVMQALFGQVRGESRLLRHMMQRLGLHDSVFFDFSKPITRLALWRGQELGQLILYLGAVFHFQLLRRIVTREDIIKTQRLLGDDLYRFLQQRAPLLTHNISTSITFPQHMGLKKRFVLAGMLCLRAAFAGYPPAFWKRLVYKLEREYYVLWKRYAKCGQVLETQAAECAVLVQKVAIEIKMGVSRDGKILFN
ncbi:YOP protein translocation protein K (YscK) [Thiothrix caldifontis]|jgi:YOP proteins translocation protein K (YscK).|uniref:YOP protein translocation protein K (YscK) n=1 Tax=Thiothrix caldifontis TaxID=525918 RepID=A0A1H4ENT0_9GAMM|nr:SctK family type III secretion system sorting platform protein [Thiothrix caldifontis]SEA86308.1 YOP protein translocation protein K (YscK) [Thiothrix caldifontis]